MVLEVMLGRAQLCWPTRFEPYPGRQSSASLSRLKETFDDPD